jgi:uncharacterized membrane protein
MQTIQFILALVIGWFLADRDLSLPWIALSIIAASFVLTLLTLVVQHWTLPPAARSRHGLTLLQGQFSWLFFGTIVTIAVTAVVVVLIRQRLG